MEITAILIITIILNIIIILISFYLIFLYIKSKSFHTYPCYNIMVLSFILFFDNIIRLIPTVDAGEVLQYIQAFLLTFLDKLVLTTITSQAIIIYLGVCKTNLYFNHEMSIYFLTLITGTIVSIIVTSIYISFGITNYANPETGDNGSIYFYCEGPPTKIIIDTVFNSVFLFFNILCVGLLLIYISRKKTEANIGIIEDLDYGHHRTKILLMFIVNSLTFVESYLIIYDKFPLDDVDLIYLLTCLIIDLYYTINKIIIKEIMKIFCKKLYDEKYPAKSKTSSITDEEELEHKRKDSFDDE